LSLFFDRAGQTGWWFEEKREMPAVLDMSPYLRGSLSPKAERNINAAISTLAYLSVSDADYFAGRSVPDIVQPAYRSGTDHGKLLQECKKMPLELIRNMVGGRKQTLNLDLGDSLSGGRLRSSGSVG